MAIGGIWGEREEREEGEGENGKRNEGEGVTCERHVLHLPMNFSLIMEKKGSQRVIGANN